MKKIFTLVAVALAAMSANAQDYYAAATYDADKNVVMAEEFQNAVIDTQNGKSVVTVDLTNVTMTAEEMQGEPAAKENETKAEKFIRIGEYRMNKAVDAIGRLENLANRGSYEYTQEQVDAMFQALEGRVAEIKARFTPKKTAESKTFSFGTTE